MPSYRRGPQAIAAAALRAGAAEARTSRATLRGQLSVSTTTRARTRNHVISGGLGIATLALDGDEFLAAPGIGLLISGLVTVAVGGPLMGKGKRRRTAYYDWLHQQSLRDQARVTPRAPTLRGGGGLSLRVVF